jgi:hypothetical protein
MHVYEIRPRKDKRGFDLISDALPFAAFATGGLWYLKVQAKRNRASPKKGDSSFSRYATT